MLRQSLSDKLFDAISENNIAAVEDFMSQGVALQKQNILNRLAVKPVIIRGTRP